MAGEGKSWSEKRMSDNELDRLPKSLTIVTATARNERKRSETTKDYKLAQTYKGSKDNPPTPGPWGCCSGGGIGAGIPSSSGR